MSSGFSAAGQDFYPYGRIARKSVLSNGGHDQYRSIDSSSQVVHGMTDLIGKRQLPVEFQSQNRHYMMSLQQSHQQQQGPGFYLRSVKPRNYHQTSPISPLSPVDFSTAAISPDLSSVSHSPATVTSRPILHPVPASTDFTANGVVPAADILPEKKMMSWLQELERQLLDDDDRDETGAVSAIANSEWSETMRGLLSLTPATSRINPASPSPSSSTSSSSPSLPAPTCPKQALVDAASALTEGDPGKAMEILAIAAPVADARGGSEDRVVGYAAAALRRRLGGVPPENELSGDEHAAAMQKLYELSPCFRLALSAANRAILEATADLPETIHVVDFDGVHRPGAAVQYQNLIHALAARQGGKPVVLKITSVAEPGGGYGRGGERLRQLTDRVGVSVKLSFACLGIRDLSRDSLGCGSEEALAVNLAFKLNQMPDESVRTDNPRDELLRRVKGLEPRVVAVAEQEMNSNTAPLATHVAGVCAYYAALLDSLDSGLPRESPDRVQVEEGLARKISNAVACEGKDRLERCEMFGKWRARLRMAELEPRSLAEAFQSDARGNMGFTVKEEGGGICFGWMGRTLTVVSAWR